MQTVVCFDVWGTLIIPEREGFIKHICESIREVLKKHGIDIDVDSLVKIFSETDREVRGRRRRECTLIPPEECVRVLLEKIVCGKVSLDVVDEVEESICNAVSESPHVKPAEKVHELLTTLRENGHKLAIVSNVVFWRSSATRRILRRFNIDSFDIEIYADLVKEVKPNTRMLRIVESSLDSKVIAHIGDSLFEDVSMAIAYEVPAIFIDRKRQILNESENVRVELGGRVIVVRELKNILEKEIMSIIARQQD